MQALIWQPGCAPDIFLGGKLNVNFYVLIMYSPTILQPVTIATVELTLCKGYSNAWQDTAS